MSTARDLIIRSLKLLGVVAGGETPSAEELNDGLDTLNDMIDSWSNERMFFPADVLETFTLIAGQNEYTFGPGGDFDSLRPFRIEIAKLIDVSNSNNPSYPIEILTEQEYRDIILKGTQSTLPRWLYYAPEYPFGKVFIYTTPSAPNELQLNSWKPLSQIPTLDTVIDLAPGFTKAIRFNLAIDLAPEYGKEPSQAVVLGATAGRENVKRVATRKVILGVDSELRHRHGRFNILTGK